MDGEDGNPELDSDTAGVVLVRVVVTVVVLVQTCGDEPGSAIPGLETTVTGLLAVFRDSNSAGVVLVRVVVTVAVPALTGCDGPGRMGSDLLTIVAGLPAVATVVVVTIC